MLVGLLGGVGVVGHNGSEKCDVTWTCLCVLPLFFLSEGTGGGFVIVPVLTAFAGLEVARSLSPHTYNHTHTHTHAHTAREGAWGKREGCVRGP